MDELKEKSNQAVAVNDQLDELISTSPTTVSPHFSRHSHRRSGIPGQRLAQRLPSFDFLPKGKNLFDPLKSRKSTPRVYVLDMPSVVNTFA